MKTYTENEVIELLKKFGREYAKNVNSDKWYFNWLEANETTPNIDLQGEAEQREAISIP